MMAMRTLDKQLQALKVKRACLVERREECRCKASSFAEAIESLIKEPRQNE